MQRGGCIKWDSAGVVLVIAVVSLFIRAWNLTLQERTERLSMRETAGILFEIAIFLIGTTEKANILSYHFFHINQSSALSRKISCTWRSRIWSYSRRRNHHSNFWLVKLGGLGLSSLGAMNEANQMEASKIIFAKVWSIYEVPDPGKE